MATENLSGKSDEMLEVNLPMDKHPSPESNSAFNCLDNVPMKHDILSQGWPEGSYNHMLTWPSLFLGDKDNT